MMWRQILVGAVVGVVTVLVLQVASGSSGLSGFWENLLPGTDESHVTVLDDARGASPYTTDEKTVYYRGKPIPGSDPKTFVVIDAFYAKDKKQLYFVENPYATSSGVRTISGLDNEALMSCGGDEDRDDCVKDTRLVFVVGRQVPDADAKTFEMISDGYGKDARRVYSIPRGTDGGAQVIAGADPQTFAALGNGYAKDATRVYYEGAAISGTDVATFVLVFGDEKCDAKDRYRYYFEGKVVTP